MIILIVIILILLATVAGILFVPIRPDNGAEQDALSSDLSSIGLAKEEALAKEDGHEPQLIDAICPDCHCVRVNRIWRSESYRIAAGPSFPAVQCPACYVKQCQAKSAANLEHGRWLSPSEIVNPKS